MPVGEGTFVLYSRIEPPLEAGDYRFTTNQALTATGLGAAQLPVAELATHVTVRSPRYALPPDQVLSTFPPAASEGAYGFRLPQVVIRRRTLPWERAVQAGVTRSTPWLALVLIAEGEAELKLNQPVAECVTPGRSLPGRADAELGNYLQIRKSMVDRIFPTRLDVPLLAHAREVDIHDTELMMGDDDGFLAVVIANRLPLPGRDANGESVPVKYLACLVNLEGQFLDLLERAPEPAPVTRFPSRAVDMRVDEAQWDHTRMGRPPDGGPAGHPTGAVVGVPSTGAAPYAPASTWTAAPEHFRGSADVYVEMARDFGEAVVSGFVAGDVVTPDTTLRFPVLLHWSFTSFGSTTFRSLMEGLDSGLLGTVGEDPARPGRPPLEVVETGHTGLAHRTRRGDPVRSWYRGPFVPHPAVQTTSAQRLPLAHAADQLRIVIPDGREDISLAAAFEIGRLLALAHPSMVAALLRWRQSGYQTARRSALWSDFRPFLDELLGDRAIDSRLGVHLGRSLVDAVVATPADFLGEPRALVDPGRSLTIDGSPELLLAGGFGLPADVLIGDPATVLGRLRETPVVRPSDPDPRFPVEVLADTLNRVVDRLVADTLGPRPDTRPERPDRPDARPERERPPRRAAAPDALDRLIDRLDAAEGRPAGPDEEVPR